MPSGQRVFRKLAVTGSTPGPSYPLKIAQQQLIPTFKVKFVFHQI